MKEVPGLRSHLYKCFIHYEYKQLNKSVKHQIPWLAGNEQNSLTSTFS